MLVVFVMVVVVAFDTIEPEAKPEIAGARAVPAEHYLTDLAAGPGESWRWVAGRDSPRFFEACGTS